MVFRVGLLLVIALSACGESGPAPIVLPDLDGGTHICGDDYQATVAHCMTVHNGGGEKACWRVAVDRFEPCIGPQEACRMRCLLRDRIGYADAGLSIMEQQNSANQACFAQCPEAGP